MGEGPLEMVMKGLIMIDIIDLETMGRGMV
jgi:hypothetical protein